MKKKIYEQTKLKAQTLNLNYENFAMQLVVIIVTRLFSARPDAQILFAQADDGKTEQGSLEKIDRFVSVFFFSTFSPAVKM